MLERNVPHIPHVSFCRGPPTAAHVQKTPTSPAFWCPQSHCSPMSSACVQPQLRLRPPWRPLTSSGPKPSLLIHCTLLSCKPRLELEDERGGPHTDCGTTARLRDLRAGETLTRARHGGSEDGLPSCAAAPPAFEPSRRRYACLASCFRCATSRRWLAWRAAHHGRSACLDASRRGCRVCRRGGGCAVGRRS